MTYPYLFTIAVNFTLDNEKGYVFDKDDPGGETNFGISKRSYPNVDIKHLTRQGAIQIYYTDYWNSLYEQITDKKVAVRLFDTGVNMGAQVAVAILQTTLKHFYNLPIKIDGQFGKMTLRALNLALSKDAQFYKTYRDVLNTFYIILTLLSAKKKKYLNGWENRLNKQIMNI